MAMLFCSTMYCAMTVAGYELLRWPFLAGMLVAGIMSLYLSYTEMKAEQEFRERHLREWMEKAHREEKEDE